MDRKAHQPETQTLKETPLSLTLGPGTRTTSGAPAPHCISAKAADNRAPPDLPRDSFGARPPAVCASVAGYKSPDPFAAEIHTSLIQWEQTNKPRRE